MAWSAIQLCQASEFVCKILFSFCKTNSSFDCYCLKNRKITINESLLL